MGPPVTSPLVYDTYAEQQYAELLRLFEILVGLEEPVLLGDLNHGPALQGNQTWELPFHYGLVNARGFISPYVILDGRCTWCGARDNPAAASSFPFDETIDHVYLLVDSYPRVQHVEVLTNTLMLESNILFLSITHCSTYSVFLKLSSLQLDFLCLIIME